MFHRDTLSNLSAVPFTSWTWSDSVRFVCFFSTKSYPRTYHPGDQMAAGDILRGHYQQLSADPNSLANLDQDLPNNLQREVPIFSLPEDWLWVSPIL